MKTKHHVRQLTLWLLVLLGVSAICIKSGKILYGGKSTVNQINITSVDIKYWSQISVPSAYYVTDDTILEEYDTQGGMAPPTIILSKNVQILSNYYDQITKNPKNDCIVIWGVSSGFDSVDEWSKYITNFQGSLKQIDTIDIGVRKVPEYIMKLSDRSMYLGYLKLEDNASMYFHTCNANNKLDFENIIKSMKFRSDLNYNE